MLLSLRETSGPLYRRVYLALKAKIRAGGLGPAARVPSTRALARDLGVSRNTVLLAYEQLAAEGYLVSRHRGGTSVAAVAPPRPAAAPARVARPRAAAISGHARRLTARLDVGRPRPAGPRPVLRWDFRYGRPAVDEFPREIWRRLLATHARRASADALGYGAPAGHARLRAALSDYLARARGVVSDPDRIVVVNGTQQALDLLARVLLDPGDGAVVEEPHYPGATIPFEAVGARLLRVRVDGGGLDPTRLPAAARRPRLAYVTPCHQFPTGVIMPLERRLALLRWASRVGAWVVEDDYVSEFRYEGHPLEALQSLDREERAIYLGSFSKTLFPALRVGYLVLPRALVRPIVAAKWAADRFSAPLYQEALADLITSGQFERYLRRAGARNARRRRVLIATLRECFGDRVEIAGENTGVHLVVWLEHLAPRELEAGIARAARAGVGIYPVAPFYAVPPRRAGLLFGYAALTEAEIRAGVRRLADALEPARVRAGAG
ncbi:MAG TPA: PLP-dependent aminotransferase family protein [Methylomirabilota bacterium]|nr:PLP-dependent aminotransferase family protein [Methylomirabilota bacterium]